MEMGGKEKETIPSMNENLLILIAEDNDDDGYLVQHALKKAGLPNPYPHLHGWRRYPGLSKGGRRLC